MVLIKCLAVVGFLATALVVEMIGFAIGAALVDKMMNRKKKE